MEEDLHMALCVVKVLALVVIASSLLSISGSLSGPSYGYASNPDLSVTTGLSGRAWNVAPQNNDVGSSAYLGPGYGSETSAAPFSNRYEPPTFWNIGDLSTYEGSQHAEAATGPLAAGTYDTVPGATTTGYFKNPFKGFASNGLGVRIAPGKGYATSLPNGGVTAAGVPMVPF